MIRVKSGMLVEIPCMCTRCFNHWIANGYMFISLSGDCGVEVCDGTTVKAENGAYVCKTCGGNIEIIDSAMLPIISALNKRGYATTNCCEGHASSSMIESPYISFEEYVPVSMFDGLPDGWYVGTDADFQKQCELCGSPGPTIYYGPGHCNVDDIVDMVNWDEEALLDWASNLPTINEPTEPSAPLQSANTAKCHCQRF